MSKFYFAHFPYSKETCAFSITQFGAGAPVDYSNVVFGFGALANILSATYGRIPDFLLRDGKGTVFFYFPGKV